MVAGASLFEQLRFNLNKEHIKNSLYPPYASLIASLSSSVKFCVALPVLSSYSLLRYLMCVLLLLYTLNLVYLLRSLLVLSIFQ